MATPADRESYDVVYARFLLTHLTDPAAALGNITRRLARGEVLIVEDIDFTGHFCHPHTTRSGRTSTGTAGPCRRVVQTPTSGRGSPACCSTPDELNQAVDELYAFAGRDDTVLSLPRIVQSWGRRPD
jgi:ubiquinone/menaquinone biosynthesis C-methylase UbiE